MKSGASRSQNTCKHSTQKDFFSSRVSCLPSLQVSPLMTPYGRIMLFFKVHLVVAQVFVLDMCGEHQAQLNGPHALTFCFSNAFATERDPTQKYTIMWNEVENAASRERVRQGMSPFGKRQCGRGSTLDTNIVKKSFHLSPVKPGRRTDVQPLFGGLSQQHAHWFRQLRRIQSFVRFRKVHPVDTEHGHAVALWGQCATSKRI